MESGFDIDEFAFTKETPEGTHSIVPRESLSGIPEVSNNERYRIRRILAEIPTEDDGKIRKLYDA